MSLRPITHEELPFEAEWDAGLSSDGSIVLADDPHLYLYKHRDGRYNQLWKKPLPCGLGYNCYKAANNTEIALQADTSGGGAITQHYSHHMECITTSQHDGHLLDLLGDGSAVYGRRSGSGGWVIDVHKSNGSLTLQPPAGCEWGGGLSVSELPTHHMAVVDQRTKSLTVFDRDGRNKLHTFLIYVSSYKDLLENHTLLMVT